MSENEIWKDVVGYEGLYKVSNKGNIYSVRRNAQRKAGDTYRPIVHILKVKKDKPTVIKVSGEEYILRHKDQYRGKRKNG